MAHTLKTTGSVEDRAVINELAVAVDTLEGIGTGGSLAGLSVLGRAANSTGATAAITAATDGHVVRRSGTAVGFGTIVAAGIAAGAVTTAKLGTEVRGEAQALSGAGAINLTTPTTRFTSTGAAQALTLADGSVAGQRKKIVHAVDGGSGVLTAGGSLHLGDSLATITLANVRDWIELEWSVTGTVWNLIGWGGLGVSFT